MPEFVSRSWGWFQARPTIQKVLIVLAALIVLGAISRVVSGIAGLVFFLALIALVVQLIRRRPVRPWAIAAGGALVVALAFGGLSSALLSGPEAEGPPRVEKAKKPQPEKPPKPPADEGQASEQGAKPAPEAKETKSENKPEMKHFLLHIRAEDGAGYNGDFVDSNGTTFLKSSYNDSLHKAALDPGEDFSATVLRLTDYGDVRVTLYTADDQRIQTLVANGEDNAVNMVILSEDLKPLP